MLYPVRPMRFGAASKPKNQHAQETVYYIGGPTASGKTALSVALAKRIPDAVFINADTMQLYHGLGKLAASPSDEELAGMDHRLFGVLGLAEDCSRSQWLAMATREIDQLLKAGKTPVLVGGSRSFLAELARAAYGVYLPVDQDNAVTFSDETVSLKRAFPYQLKTIILMPQASAMSEGIGRWVRSVTRSMDHVAQLADAQQEADGPAFWAFAYQELKPVLSGECSLLSALHQLKDKTMNYAREQMALYNRLYEAVCRSAQPDRVIRIESTDAGQRVDQALRFMNAEEKEKPISD